jgi:hypothetical protein
MSSPTGPDNGLPVRMPRPRKSGRHRRPAPVVVPANAPALVLAVPGTPSGSARGLAEESLSIARSELPGLNARVGYVEGDDKEFPGLHNVLVQAVAERDAAEREAAERATAERESAERAAEEARAAQRKAAVSEGRHKAGHAAAEAAEEAERAEEGAEPGPRPRSFEGPAAVVIPLLAGPNPSLIRQVRQIVLASGTGAELTDVLGPHPLLAEGVHVKLSEAGLARADRARLFTVATAADGIILATVGGEDAVQAAGITGMLLAARLAVPVLAAGLDEEGAVARIAEQLRESGSQQLAVAPCLIGPEVPEGLLEAAQREAGCSVAEALGSYPAVGKLIASTYAAKAGIAQPQSTQSMGVH